MTALKAGLTRAGYSTGSPAGAGAALQAVNRDALNKRAFAPTMRLRFPPRSAQLYCGVVIILMFKAKCLSLVPNCRNFQSSQHKGAAHKEPHFFFPSLTGHHPETLLSAPNHPSCWPCDRFPVVELLMKRGTANPGITNVFHNSVFCSVLFPSYVLTARRKGGPLPWSLEVTFLFMCILFRKI